MILKEALALKAPAAARWQKVIAILAITVQLALKRKSGAFSLRVSPAGAAWGTK